MSVALSELTPERYDDYIQMNVDVYGHFHGYSEPCSESRALLHWKAAERPDAPNIMWIAAFEGQLAGFLSAATMQLNSEGQVLRAFETFEAGVLPAFRRKGLMGAIVDEVHRRLERTHALAVGFPNPPLERVYKRVGYQRVGVYTYWYQTLDYRPVVHQRVPIGLVSSLVGSALNVVRASSRRAGKDCEWASIGEPGEDHMERWMTRAGARPFAWVKSLPEWRWRLSKHGLLEGWWYDVARRGEWQGSFVLARGRQRRDDPSVVRIAELFARSEEALDAVVCCAISAAQRAGYSAVTTGCLDGHLLERLLKARGFRPGSQLAFTIRASRDTEVNERWFQAANWELFGADRLL